MSQSIAGSGSRWRLTALCVVTLAVVLQLALQTVDSVCPAGYTTQPLKFSAPDSHYSRMAGVVQARLIYCRAWLDFSTATNKVALLASVPSALVRMLTGLSYLRPAIPPQTESVFVPDSMLHYYAKGPADFMFFAGAFVALSLIQVAFGVAIRKIEVVMRKHIGKAAHTEDRFIEQAFLLAWYVGSSIWGFYIYYNSNFYPIYDKAAGMWSHYPEANLVGYIKAYYLIQLAFWTQQLVALSLLTAAADRRKDHWAMVGHHIITTMLIGASYVVHMTPVGAAVLVVMDAADAVLSLAKCFKYLGPRFQKVCDITFGAFVIVWIFTRHIVFFFLMHSIFWVGPATLKHVSWDPWFTRQLERIEDLNRPGTYITDNMWVFYKVLFSGLQILLLYWLMLLFRVVARVLKGTGAQDVREDDED